MGSVTKALQPPLDVLLWNVLLVGQILHGTDQHVLLLLHGALASNTLDIYGLLTISRCYLDVFLVFLRLTIAFEWRSPHRSLDRLLLTFHGSEGSSDVCTILYNMAEVVCQGCHLTRAYHTDG